MGKIKYVDIVLHTSGSSNVQWFVKSECFCAQTEDKNPENPDR